MKAVAKLKVSQLSPLLNLNTEERRQVRIVIMVIMVMKMMRIMRIMMKMRRIIIEDFEDQR